MSNFDYHHVLLMWNIHFADAPINLTPTRLNYNPMVPFALCPLPPPPYYAVHPLSALTSAVLPAYRSSASCWKTQRSAHPRCDAAPATGRGPRSGDAGRVPVRTTDTVSGHSHHHPSLLWFHHGLVPCLTGHYTALILSLGSASLTTQITAERHLKICCGNNL